MTPSASMQRPPHMRLQSTSSDHDHNNTDSALSDSNSQPSLALSSVSSSMSSSSSSSLGPGSGSGSGSGPNSNNSKPTAKKNGKSRTKGNKTSSCSTKNSNNKAPLCLGKIGPLISQTSLLDMSHDEDDASLDMDFHIPVSVSKLREHQLGAGGVDKDCTSITADMTSEASMIRGDRDDENAHACSSAIANANEHENTSMMEKSLNISESLTSSFCNPAQCSISMADCSAYLDLGCTNPNTNNNSHKSRNTTQKKTLLSDTLVQNRLMEDFHFLLGSSVMPCWEERGLFSNCFGINLETSSDDHVDANDDCMGLGSTEEMNQIRNRAGESWRARAYRIKRLREERMSMDRSMHMNMQGHVHIRENGRGRGHGHDHQQSDDRMGGMMRAVVSPIPMVAPNDGLLDANSPLTRSTSYGHGSGYGRKDVARKEKPRLKPKLEVNVEPLGCMIGDCIEPISPLEGNGNEVDIECTWKDNHRQEFLDEQDLCYDSDPGIAFGYSEREFELNLDAMRASPDSSLLDNVTMLSNLSSQGRSRSMTGTPSSPMNRSTRPFSSPKKKWSFRSPRRRRRRPFTSDSFDESLDGDRSVQSRGAGRARANSASESIKAEFYGNGAQEGDPNWSPPDRSFDELDINFKVEYGKKKISVLDNDRDIVECVQDALNSTWTLAWHHPSSDGSKKSPLFKTKSNVVPSISGGNSTRCIQVWFERGNRIRHNDILEPKLMWRDAYHPDLASERKLNISTAQGPYKICLLSVCRILEMNNIDRTRYPFAKKSCSFMIRTSDDEEFVFEASSPKQRDAIVHTWKLVVARLASQAVVGDGEGMVGEFFVSSAFGVP